MDAGTDAGMDPGADMGIGGASPEGYGFRTRSVHAGGRPDPTTGARAVPIYQTTSFVFEDALDASTLFALQKFGNIYSRIANPTVAAFEERMASLEGGLGAVATSSGQAAELLVFIGLAGAGDHLVASSRLYGGTRTLLDVTLRRLGDRDHVRRPVTTPTPSPPPSARRTKAIYTEVIGNPSGCRRRPGRRWPRSPTTTTSRSWSTPPWPPRPSAGRSSTAPTSSSTPPPSSSAATARPSAGWSSSPAASTGPTAGSR